MAKKKDYTAIENDNKAFEKHKFNYVKNALRIATYKWPYANRAYAAARIERGFYKCASCGEAFGPKQVQKDHIVPVVDPFTGFTNWQDFIDRLFVKSNGYQILCLGCHETKTATENQIRVKNGQKPIKVKKKLTKKRRLVKIKK